MGVTPLIFVVFATASALRLNTQHAHGNLGAGLELERKNSTSGIDVVIPMHKFNCVVKDSVKNINAHIKPRRILIITNASHCSEITDIADNVKCLDEDKVLPGITKHSLAQKICILQGGCGTEHKQYGFGGHSSAGWYLQQFIKLSIGDSPLLRESDILSEVYLVMDSDMIPFADLSAYDHKGRMPLMSGGPQHGNSVEFRVGKSFGECDYERAYNILTGETLHNQKKHHGYVPHHMVMHQKYVKEMLTAFSKESWIDKVLDVSCGDGRNSNECGCGFSEYASYASWMKSHHPDAVYDLQELFVRIYGGKQCCLSEKIEHKARKNGKLAIVLEQGGC